MNMQTIEKEIHDFNTDYFSITINKVDDYLDFIDNNQLYTPKTNHIISIKFLIKMINKFKSIDPKIFTSTVVKILHDIKLLQHMYAQLKTDEDEIPHIFASIFTLCSTRLSFMDKELKKLQNLDEKTLITIKRKNNFTKTHKELTDIYYEIFYKGFYSNTRYLSHHILKILNSKIYFLDKLIWQESKHSKILASYFQTLHLSENPNTQEYMYYMSNAIKPLSLEYNYIQSCLRIYR